MLGGHLILTHGRAIATALPPIPVATEDGTAPFVGLNRQASGMAKQCCHVELIPASTTHFQPAIGIVALLEQRPRAVQEGLRRGEEIAAVDVHVISAAVVDLLHVP